MIRCCLKARLRGAVKDQLDRVVIKIVISFRLIASVLLRVKTPDITGENL